MDFLRSAHEPFYESFDMPENQRRFYRLPYPDPMMPKMRIGDSEYLVPEISEGGLRIRQCRGIDKNPFLEFREGDEVTGTITFDDGEVLGISGIIYRRDKQDYIIAPLEGISFKRIVLEQRRVLNRFPALRAK